MTKVFKIVGHHIEKLSGTEYKLASITEIFQLLKEQDEDFRAAIPDLRYSRINGVLAASVVSQQGELKICLESKIGGRSIGVDFVDGKIPDHTVDSNKVYNLIGEYDEFKAFLVELGVDSNGGLSFAAYLQLMQQQEQIERFHIKINIDDSFFKKERISTEAPSELGSLANILYPYQRVGFYWLRSMLSEIGGGILGDEMGLGKTLQVIAIARFLISQGAKSLLVVAPVSLLENWKKECQKFAPELNVGLHQGDSRSRNFRSLLQYDVVVVAYSTLVRDYAEFDMIEWDLVILDEAQNIKNPLSQRSIRVRNLPRKRSLVVTGTPFENHIKDIWSLVEFIIPNLFGSLKHFMSTYADSIEGAEKIEKTLTPLMLRRLVKDVANDLPEKIIIPQPLKMSPEEAKAYCSLLGSSETDLEKASKQTLFNMLMPLRMFCTHPFLSSSILENTNPLKASVKYQRLCEILEEIFLKGEKAIIFTSFKKMFELFSLDLESRFHIFINKINGATPKEQRQQIVDEFNQYQGPGVLILNPVVAGTGLNITGANHVIHYNLEWNPALEDQSTARAYRRGQTKVVFVHRLFYCDTVEEVINERLMRKREISMTAIIGSLGGDIDRTDLLKALSKKPLFDE